MLQLDAGGIMVRLQEQRRPFKPSEPEPLRPLKLEHFYFILGGIAVGLAASFTVCLFNCVAFKKKSNVLSN